VPLAGISDVIMCPPVATSGSCDSEGFRWPAAPRRARPRPAAASGRFLGGGVGSRHLWARPTSTYVCSFDLECNCPP
jgi:hypothetical protein